jgi:hypothetical protein
MDVDPRFLDEENDDYIFWLLPSSLTPATQIQPMLTVLLPTLALILIYNDIQALHGTLHEGGNGYYRNRRQR